MTAEDSPHPGQSGRVGRVFWRAGEPWVLVRGHGGEAFAVPWAATDLPAPVGPVADEPPGHLEAVLLSPAAVQALARFVGQWRARGTAPGEGAADARPLR